MRGCLERVSPMIYIHTAKRPQLGPCPARPNGQDAPCDGVPTACPRCALPTTVCRSDRSRLIAPDCHRRRGVLHVSSRWSPEEHTPTRVSLCSHLCASDSQKRGVFCDGKYTTCDMSTRQFSSSYNGRYIARIGSAPKEQREWSARN